MERLNSGIRSADSEAKLDQIICAMWGERSGGQLTESEAERLDAAADQRRKHLKRTAPRQAVSPTKQRYGCDTARRPSFRFQASGRSSAPVRVPAWIGGTLEFMSALEARKAFYLRRELWRQQLNRDCNLSKLDLRVAWEMSFGLNADPTEKRLGQCFQSLATFSKALACRPESFVASTRRLVELGHLRIFQGRGRGNANRYEPVIPDDRGSEPAMPQIA